MTLKALVASKRDEILRIAALHGARDVRLFGSAARGDTTDQSDIDLLINLEAGRSLMDHADLVVELERLLGRRVDVVTERGLRPRVRDAIMRDTTPL
jgi:predicted nucleotidyltransferase